MALVLSAFLVIDVGTNPARAARVDTIVVADDPGGNLKQRLARIDRYRRQNRRVEIQRGYCLSACTMYLGLPNTCVSRSVTFGFHGPGSSHYGIALAPKKFEYWSRVIAAHYPEPLRSWYLQTGRNVIVGFYEMTGAELIEMGVSECS